MRQRSARLIVAVSRHDGHDSSVRTSQRLHPFDDWRARFTAGEKLHDYAHGDEVSKQWWQAHTDVLEVAKDDDGRQYALVAVTIYPHGVHSSPPAPSAGLKVYEDRVVEGTWADGSEFLCRQQHAG
jgi:hypothetical protein